MNWRTAAGCALLLAACSRGERLGGRPPIAEPRRPEVGGGGVVGREAPQVRIGIAVDTSTVTLGAPADFELRRLSGEVLARGRAGELWQLGRSAAGGLLVRSAGGETEYQLPVRVTTGTGEFIDIAGRRYRGQALINARGADRLTAINVVGLEQYLLGVVPREMGRRPASEIEALKAQAVAARTYAIGNLGGREQEGFDYYATVMDQVYGGTADEDSIVSRAVATTRGEIVTYQGTPILAYYSSTCGGHTADIRSSVAHAGAAAVPPGRVGPHPRHGAVLLRELQPLPLARRLDARAVARGTGANPGQLYRQSGQQRPAGG